MLINDNFKFSFREKVIKYFNKFTIAVLDLLNFI